MTEEELAATFEPLIRTELDDLKSLREGAKGDRKPVELDQQSVGRVSRIDSLQVQAMSNAAEARRQKRVRALQAALQRIEDGEFGYCTECAEPIAEGRLRTDPAATRCISCAR
ncbi:MAG: TraR/DksA C4-type zinc finger protein [Henriciella sp.]|mgnify:CR=1 FL=1|uniref:TraR/DksA family transcriptional regulator n=1 Tax=Henriciella sp. TaxID=1968823 RepID=UPI002632B712|nr:TraR/DksA C4-type zinc finger protein [Henriciella sp.]